MTGRLVGSILVVLLVISAGCLGGSVPDVPDGGTDAPDGDGSGGADDGGTGDGGADDGDVTVVDDREAALEDAGSFTVTWRMTVTEDGAVAGETTSTSAVDYANERYATTFASGSGGEQRTALSTFHADGTTYQRVGSDEEASYAAMDAEFDPAVRFGAQSYVRDGDDLAEFEREGTETFDGVQVTRYVQTENPAWLAAQAGSDDEITWTEFTFEVLVDDEGLVRSQGWHADGVDQDGVDHTVGYSYELTGVGSTTVEEPEWTAEARAQSGN